MISRTLVENPTTGLREVSAQCPSCRLHELVAVHLARQADGTWSQTNKPGLLPGLLPRLMARAMGRSAPRPTAPAPTPAPTDAMASVQIDACPVCMGAWFDHGELDLLSGEYDSASEVSGPEFAPSSRPCPHGHGAMVEQHLHGILETPVDRCLRCDGIWLDGQERRKLAKATTREGQGTQTSRWLRRGAIWAAQVLTHLPVEVDNPARATPWAVFSLLAVLLIVFQLQVYGVVDTLDHGLVSGRLVRNLGSWHELSTVGSYIALHATWVHLLGNAYFLYTFGDNVEHLFGRLRFVLFFVGAGVVGGLAHVAFSQSTALSVVGASGSIAGVLGAYLWAFPRQRLFQVVLWVQIKIPMWIYLFVWVGFHLMMGLFATGDAAEGTAWFVHLGGFLLGLAVTPWVLRWRRGVVARSVRVPALIAPDAPIAQPP